jgi:alginate O-acetyltransferase complex protein AlgJ
MSGSQHRSPVRRAADRVTIALFVAAIGLPLCFVRGRGVEPVIERTELRRAAAFPTIEWRRLGPLNWPRKFSINAFPRAFEAWFNDHLGFRRPFIRAYNLAKVCGLTSENYGRPAVGAAPRSPVIVGREGWLFYSGDRLVDDYRSTCPFSRDELERWRTVLEERRQWLAERGIAYVVMVAPNQQTIYGEYLPRSMNRVRDESRLDQLLDYLRENDGPEILDVRGALLAAKSQHRTYHKTDTHCNDFGAFVGYQQLMRRLHFWFPEAEPMPLAEFEVQTVDHEGYLLAKLLDSPAPWREEQINLVWKRPPRAGVEPVERTSDGYPTYRSAQPLAPLTSAVVIHDSFYEAMAPYLQEHFRRTQCVWTYEFPSPIIEAERPQVVIQEFVERQLMNDPPANPPELKRTRRREEWAKGQFRHQRAAL